jgi:uncharacterized protein YdbL (DUF1318 family)
MTKRFFLRRAAAALVLAATLPLAATNAAAQSLGDWKTQGVIGERPDGLVGIVGGNAPAGAQAVVSQVNRERMANYQRIAQETNAPIDAVQARAGAQLTSATPPGQYIMNAAGQWMKK